MDLRSEPPTLEMITFKVCILKRIEPLPKHCIVKFFEEIWRWKQYEFLRTQFSNLDMFAILLNREEKRIPLLKSFSSIRDGNPTLANVLLESYKISKDVKHDIKLGLKLGEFFIELGAFKPAIGFLKVAVKRSKIPENQIELNILIECYSNLIYAQAYSYQFKDVLKSFSEVSKILEPYSNQTDVESSNSLVKPNCAEYYSSMSFLYFVFGDYFKALQFTNDAVKELNDQLPDKVIIKVLRLSAKVYARTRKFSQARLLIQHALDIAFEHTARNVHIYAETLMDYGFYFSELSDFQTSQEQYDIAISIYTSNLYESNNLYLALAQRDFARAWLLQIDDIHFHDIRRCLVEAFNNMHAVLEENHVMFLNTILDVKATCLEIRAIRALLYNPNMSRVLLIESKIWRKESLRAHKKFFDDEWCQKSIRTVHCMLALGQVYYQLNQIQRTEQYYRQAEQSFRQIAFRTNAEYCLIHFRRAQLIRFKPILTSHDATIAIESLKSLIKLLIRFETEKSEFLGIFYTEIIEICQIINNQPEYHRYSLDLYRWNLAINSDGPFESITDGLPMLKPINTIVDMIQSINNESINIYSYAIFKLRNTRTARNALPEA